MQILDQKYKEIYMPPLQSRAPELRPPGSHEHILLNPGVRVSFAPKDKVCLGLSIFKSHYDAPADAPPVNWKNFVSRVRRACRKGLRARAVSLSACQSLLQIGLSSRISPDLFIGR
jgi:hypothetical protein